MSVAGDLARPRQVGSTLKVAKCATRGTRASAAGSWSASSAAGTTGCHADHETADLHVAAADRSRCGDTILLDISIGGVALMDNHDATGFRSEYIRTAASGCGSRDAGGFAESTQRVRHAAEERTELPPLRLPVLESGTLERKSGATLHHVSGAFTQFQEEV
jgi:hypothetical protein